MAANIYSIYGIRFDTGASTTDIGQITASSIDPAIAEAIEGGDGKVDAEFAAVMRQRPRIQFRTRQIAALLGVVVLDGFGFDDVVDGKNVTLYLRRRAHGGTFNDTAAAIKCAVLKGLAVLRSINVTQDGIAEAAVEIIPVSSDGIAAPIAVTTGQALAGTFATSQLYTQGPMYVDGAVVEGFMDMTLDTGIEVSDVASDGHVFAVQACITRRRPTISGRTLHADVLSTLGFSGKARAGNTRVFLRKKIEGGVNDVDGNTTHIRFDVAEGRISPRDFGGSDGEHVGAGVMITPTQTGGTAVIAISTAAAISGV